MPARKRGRVVRSSSPTSQPRTSQEEISMKNFLAVYLGGAETRQRREWDALDDATRQKRTQEGMKAWGDWMMKHHASVVVEGGPLGKTKRTSSHGVGDTKNNMTGYIVVKAESQEA